MTNAEKSSWIFALEKYWAAAEGGQNVSRELGGGGGKTYCRVCSPKPLLEASEIGVGLVGASFF